VSLQVPFEQRLIDLQAQIDQLSLTLQFWRQTQDHLQPMERRLSRLTEECAEILDRWKSTGERHAQAVEELETKLVGWSEVEARLNQATNQRFGDLKDLRDQTAALTDAYTTAAGSAQTGLERAEARLTVFEQELHRRMDEMTSEIRAAVSQLKLQGGQTSLAAAPAPWPLEGVARLHEQLRDTSGTIASAEGSTAEGLSPPDGVTAVPSTMLALRPGAHGESTASPSDLSERTADDAITEAQGDQVRDAVISGSNTRVLLALLAAGLIVAIGFAVLFYRQVGAVAARATEAQQDAQRAAESAEVRVKETRAEAAQQIAAARDTAIRAQVVSDVLAAPDIIRFNLFGGDETARVSAHLLMSRTRGLVFSGSRLPQPPAGRTYQIWLLTGAAAVSAGKFVPDAAGRATVASDNPQLPPRVIGVLVTTEPAAGSESPTGPPLLTRAQ
jgi:hypothetical protein